MIVSPEEEGFPGAWLMSSGHALSLLPLGEKGRG